MVFKFIRWFREQNPIVQMIALICIGAVVSIFLIPIVFAISLTMPPNQQNIQTAQVANQHTPEIVQLKQISKQDVNVFIHGTSKTVTALERGWGAVRESARTGNTFILYSAAEKFKNVTNSATSSINRFDTDVFSGNTKIKQAAEEAKQAMLEAAMLYRGAAKATMEASESQKPSEFASATKDLETMVLGAGLKSGVALVQAAEVGKIAGLTEEEIARLQGRKPMRR